MLMNLNSKQYWACSHNCPTHVNFILLWNSVKCIFGYPNLNCPTPQFSECKISQATFIFTKATWVLAIVKSCKMVPSNHQSNAENRKGNDHWRETGHLQAHSYRYILHWVLQKWMTDYGCTNPKGSQKRTDMGMMKNKDDRRSVSSRSQIKCCLLV